MNYKIESIFINKFNVIQKATHVHTQTPWRIESMIFVMHMPEQQGARRTNVLFPIEII
jgi:hypothetical protein